MAQNKPLGELLQELGYINTHQIEVALDVQKAYPKSIGEVLLALDFVTPSEIAEAVSKQTKIPLVNLDVEVVSKEALRLIPRQVAKSKNILPLRLVEGRLLVASDNVEDIMLVEHLRRVSKKNVDFVIADSFKLKKLIDLHYYQFESPIEDEIDGLIRRSHTIPEVDAKKLVELIINMAIKDKATDIHISPDAVVTQVFFRIDGVQKHYFSLPSGNHQQIVARIKILSNIDIAESRLPQDGGFSHDFIAEKYDLRVSTLPTFHGENVVLRLLPRNITLFNLSDLGFAKMQRKKLQNLVSKPQGIVLVTGPTGSGKTTTLYSALRAIDSLKKNILTVEDPIEYRFSFIKQTQINEKAGYTFAKAIRHFMRQDPDVILVGEIRDEETANLAMRASITGHLVLSTLHTNSAVGAIPRLLDMGIKPQMISTSLLAVVSQRLLRKLCPHCKEAISATKNYFVHNGFVKSKIIASLEEDKKIKFYKAKGCDVCGKTGYLGRIAISEIFEVDEMLQQYITQEKSAFELERYATTEGMTLLIDSAVDTLFRGVSDLDEIYRVVL